MLGNYLLFFLFSLPQDRKVTFMKSVILSSQQPQLRADLLCTFHALLLAVPRGSFISYYLKIIPASYLSLEKVVAEAKCIVGAFLKRTSLTHSFGKYLWSRIEQTIFQSVYHHVEKARCPQIYILILTPFLTCYVSGTNHLISPCLSFLLKSEDKNSIYLKSFCED